MAHICWEIHEIRKGLWAFFSWLCFLGADWLGRQSTKYKVQSSKYKVRSTKFKVQSTKYEDKPCPPATPPLKSKTCIDLRVRLPGFKWHTTSHCSVPYPLFSFVQSQLVSNTRTTTCRSRHKRQHRWPLAWISAGPCLALWRIQRRWFCLRQKWREGASRRHQLTMKVGEIFLYISSISFKQWRNCKCMFLQL